MTPSAPQRSKRRLLRCAVVFIVVVLALVGAGFPVFVRPQIDPLQRADVILVLGGYGTDRYTYGIELARRGYAPVVLFSNPYGPDTDIDEVREPCEFPPEGIALECFAPDPATTKGEARELRQLSEERGWTSVIVVTYLPHISRARYIIEQCFDGDVVMTPSREELSIGYWAWAYLYQTAGYVRALGNRSC
ncbi:YdcF family protein [Antrihabitans spumae]|uniref:YdcF family protein n=1 Tax=Antrihabitans spumae TaxID=3373370 RepID=A0ABW7KRI9_9NOCA